MRRVHVPVGLVVIVCLVLLLPACGGSSGGGGVFGPTTDRFLGTYGFVGFEGTEMTAYGLPRTTAGTRWGRLTADGLGTWEYLNLRSNAEGFVDDALIIGDGAPYTLDDLHGLGLNTNQTGALSALGDVGSAIQFTSPGITLMCKPDGMIVPGDYALFLFQYETPGAPPGSDGAAWGTVTLNPGGTTSNLVFSANANGTVLTDVVGPPGGSHASTAGGAATVSIGNTDMEGTVGPGSQIVLLAGSSQNGTNLQIVLVLVRLTSGATNALFTGDYDGLHISGPNVMGGAPAWTVRRQTMRADGAGSYQRRISVGSTDGRYVPGSANFSAPLAYTVSADGTIATPTQRGALTPDGRVLVLAGGITPGSQPSFAFYAK